MIHSGSPRAMQFAQKKQIAQATSREFPEPTDDRPTQEPVFPEEDWSKEETPS